MADIDTDTPEPDLTEPNRRRWLTGVWAPLWLAGIALPILGQLTFRQDSLREWLLLAAMLAALDVFSDRFRIEFKTGGDTSEVSAGVVTTVAAIVFLPPFLAAAVQGVSFLARPSRSAAHEAGFLSLSAWTASIIVHQFFDLSDALQALPAALVAAVVFEGLVLLSAMIYLEAHVAGDGLEYVRESTVVSGFNLGLPAVGVAVVAPFIKSTPVAFGVLLAYQAVTFLGLRLVHSEQTHRARGEFLHDSFSRYVPASVVDELEAGNVDVQLGGEETEITVMFCDVRNFTGWSEHLEPADVLKQLNGLMAALTSAIFETEGTLDKFTGDGLMAFWGAPIHQPDHAERACRTAIDMLRRVDARNVEREAEGLPALQIGVGIHSGIALVGNVGHEQRLDYTAIGDTVNTTARLEAATKDLGCDALISGATRKALGVSDLIETLGDAGEIMVKGRTASVPVWTLPHRTDKVST